MTVAQVGKWYAESLSFFVPVGSLEDVADQLTHWYREKACDGFVILPPFIDEEAVVPLLQERGVFRHDYGRGTLRETLGLSYPANPYAASSSAPTPAALSA